MLPASFKLFYVSWSRAYTACIYRLCDWCVLFIIAEKAADVSAVEDCLDNCRGAWWVFCVWAGLRLYGVSCGSACKEDGADSRRTTRPQLHDGQPVNETGQTRYRPNPIIYCMAHGHSLHKQWLLALVQLCAYWRLSCLVKAYMISRLYYCYCYNAVFSLAYLLSILSYSNAGGTVSVCLSYSCCNLWKRWPRNFIW